MRSADVIVIMKTRWGSALVDIFVAIGVCIAGIGIWLILSGARRLRRSAVTARDIEKWQARAGKQSFSVPWNMSLDIVVAFVRAWRRQDAARKIGLGAGILMFGLIVAVVDAQLLVSAGEIVVVLYQYLGVVFYPPIMIAAYFGISLSRHLRAGGQRTGQHLFELSASACASAVRRPLVGLCHVACRSDGAADGWIRFHDAGSKCRHGPKCGD